MTLMIVLAYFAVLVVLGWIAHRKVRHSTDQYFVAGRSLGTFVNSWAFLASFVSGSTMLTIVGTGLALGFAYVAALTSAATVGLVMASILVAKPLREVGEYTVPDYFRTRYRSQVMRWLVPAILLISSMGYLVAQLKAATLVLSDLLGWNYEAGLWTIGLIFLLYVSIGGFLSVTWNDVLQGILMLGMITAISVVAIVALGSFGAAFTDATVEYSALGSMADSLPVISYIGAFITWATALSVLPHVIMRVYSSRNVRSARLALGGATVIYVAIALMLTLVGIPAAANLLSDLSLKNPDQVILLLADEVLGPLGNGLFAAALLAAIMSTTAGLLMACNAAIGHDIYSRILRPQASEKQVIRVTFMATWVVGLICIFLALDPPEFIIVLSTAAVGFLASAFLAPLILGIWWGRTTTRGALWGMVIGAVSFAGAFFLFDMPTSSEILIGVPSSFIVTMLVSAFQKDYSGQKEAKAWRHSLSD